MTTLITTRQFFAVSKNDCQEFVFTCQLCGEPFVEHDGDMICEEELYEHLIDDHNVTALTPPLRRRQFSVWAEKPMNPNG